MIEANSTKNFPSTAGPRRYRLFVASALSVLMVSTNSTCVATALKAIQVSFNSSFLVTTCTISFYSLAFIVSLPVAAHVVETYGPIRVLFLSVLIFVLGSVLCAIAPNIWSLISCRVLQAVGGAAFTPCGTTIIVRFFGTNRDRIVGLFGSIFPLGTLLGPLSGLLIAVGLSWRWLFTINVPLSLLIVILLLPAIRADSEEVSRRRHFDIVGSILLGGTVGLLVTSVTTVGTGTDSVRILASVAFMAGGLVLFRILARHLAARMHPVLDPAVLFGRGFVIVNVLNGILTGGLSGLMSLLPSYAIFVFGVSEFGGGALLLYEAIFSILLTFLSTSLLRKFGYRLPIRMGSALLSVGVITIFWGSISAQFELLALGAAVAGMGVGTLNPATRNAGLQLAPEKAGEIASVRSMCTQVGIAMTITVLSVLTASVGDEILGLDVGFCFFALLFLSTGLWVRRIPEHRGAW